MNTGIRIGHDKAELKDKGDAILKILGCGAEQKTIRKALDAFVAVSEIKNVTISDNTVTMNEPSPRRR